MTDAEIARRIEDQAYDSAEGAAAAAGDGEEALDEVITGQGRSQEDRERRGLARRGATREG